MNHFAVFLKLTQHYKPIILQFRKRNTETYMSSWWKGTWRLLRAELCLLKFTRWSPKPLYLRVWLYLRTESSKRWLRGFPRGSVVKNSPANAVDPGLTPGPGRSTGCAATKPVHHDYWAYARESRNHNLWARVQQLLKPECPRAVLRNPPRWEAHTYNQRVALLPTTREKPGQQWRLVQPKINK